jgi:hypothetical protein
VIGVPEHGEMISSHMSLTLMEPHSQLGREMPVLDITGTVGLVQCQLPIGAQPCAAHNAVKYAEQPVRDSMGSRRD